MWSLVPGTWRQYLATVHNSQVRGFCHRGQAPRGPPRGRPASPWSSAPAGVAGHMWSSLQLPRWAGQSSRHVGNLPFGRLPLRSIPRSRARAPLRGLGWQRGPVQVPLMFRVDFEWPEKSQGMASCTGRPGSRSSAPAVGPPRLSLPTVRGGGCPRLPCWPTHGGTWAMRTSVAAAS